VPSAEQRALLSWGRRHRRDLPWRRTRDPWAVLVSELMLQQTQVARVLPAYAAFIDRYPDPAVLAAAPLGDALRAWSGLGYPRRAASLHRAAGIVVREHGGRVPDDLGVLLALPGVGPYTARAVLAFAYERDVGVVDTNVARVLARTRGRRLRAGEAQRAADGWVPAGHGWSWNQALFDLGASVCGKRRWSCASCPLQRWCRWRGAGADPAVGSAGVSGRQAPYAGSDREGRGRLLAALGRAPVGAADLASVMGWPEDPARAAHVAATLEADGLATVEDGDYALPGAAAIAVGPTRSPGRRRPPAR
jgi:A/G-specific adenine glycosylase